MKTVIVGGGGYIGYHIGINLAINTSNSVILFDLIEPDYEWVQEAQKLSHFHKGNLEFFKGSILSTEDLKNAFKGAQSIIHCGKEQMKSKWDLCEKVNIKGTLNVLKICREEGIQSLVYTSSFNVVFGGDEIRNGNEESTEYFPLHRHVDHYSRTKSIAEQIIISSDNSLGSGGKILRTCALRLAGVIGPMERRHLPRIMNMLPVFMFRFGYNDSLVQFLSLENVVSAHVRALKSIEEKGELVGGQAYFISDGIEINHYEYFRPLVESFGYYMPHRNNCPMILIWIVTYAIFYLHLLLHKVYNFTPLIAPAEVYKSSVTHYFSIEKARKHLNYNPQRPNDLSDVISYYKRKGEKSTNRLRSSLLTAFFILLLLQIAYFVLF